MISRTQALILSLLSARATEGAYGSDLIKLSDGKLKRGTVYTLLGRLEDAGFVKLSEDEPTEASPLPRTRYRITGEGSRALAEYVAWGAVPSGSVLQGAS